MLPRGTIRHAQLDLPAIRGPKNCAARPTCTSARNRPLFDSTCAPQLVLNSSNVSVNLVRIWNLLLIGVDPSLRRLMIVSVNGWIMYRSIRVRILLRISLRESLIHSLDVVNLLDSRWCFARQRLDVGVKNNSLPRFIVRWKTLKGQAVAYV
jgi:hypothetical protein